MLATTLVKVRKDAEQLEHAKRGTPEEAEVLRMLMKAMRGGDGKTESRTGRWTRLSGAYP
jgi:hypothetical protein